MGRRHAVNSRSTLEGSFHRAVANCDVAQAEYHLTTMLANAPESVTHYTWGRLIQLYASQTAVVHPASFYKMLAFLKDSQTTRITPSLLHQIVTTARRFPPKDIRVHTLVALWYRCISITTRITPELVEAMIGLLNKSRSFGRALIVYQQAMSASVQLTTAALTDVIFAKMRVNDSLTSILSLGLFALDNAADVPLRICTNLIQACLAHGQLREALYFAEQAEKRIPQAERAQNLRAFILTDAYLAGKLKSPERLATVVKIWTANPRVREVDENLLKISYHNGAEEWEELIAVWKSTRQPLSQTTIRAVTTAFRRGVQDKAAARKELKEILFETKAQRYLWVPPTPDLAAATFFSVDDPTGGAPWVDLIQRASSQFSLDMKQSANRDGLIIYLVQDLQSIIRAKDLLMSLKAARLHPSPRASLLLLGFFLKRHSLRDAEDVFEMAFNPDHIAKATLLLAEYDFNRAASTEARITAMEGRLAAIKRRTTTEISGLFYDQVFEMLAKFEPSNVIRDKYFPLIPANNRSAAFCGVLANLLNAQKWHAAKELAKQACQEGLASTKLLCQLVNYGEYTATSAPAIDRLRTRIFEQRDQLSIADQRLNQKEDEERLPMDEILREETEIDDGSAVERDSSLVGTTAANETDYFIFPAQIAIPLMDEIEAVVQQPSTPPK